MKRGSALLIVLGMVSFMIISAVAFSIYMRTSRQPSSYLRRTATSRYMLKAALANAIERIDGSFRSELDIGVSDNPDAGFIEGIYDDPYPGLGPSFGGNGNDDGGTKSTARYRSLGNRWVSRVFSPFSDASPEDTVATLTLEGLAYLPPAIINEVRLRSRLTRTAEWCHLTYEAGRYAFCAVDVSDCFDVNKVRATARTSAPGQRIGFSAMFPSGNSWSDLDTSSMQSFNTKANAVSGGGQVPFVSLADFNLYFGKSAFSPFCKYIGQSGNLAIVGQGDELAANALYATDTWFPPTNTTISAANRFNLSAGGDSQPFDEFDEQFGVEDVLRAAGHTALGRKIRDRLGGVGTVCLYDYLDGDSVPTSYALPTVETAPMVCALGLKANGAGVKPSLRAGGDVRETTIAYTEGGKNLEMVVKAVPYELDLGIDALHVYGLAAFPFKRLGDKPDYKTTFKVEGLVRVFLAPENLNAHLSADTPLVPRTTGDWADGYASGIVTRKMTMDGQLTYGEVKRAQDAVKPFEGTVDVSADPQKAFWEITKTIYVVDKTSGNRTKQSSETYYSMDGIAKDANAPLTYDRDGLKAKWWDDVAANAKEEMFAASAKLTTADLPVKVADAGKDISSLKCVPHVAVWIKIADGDDVVDYVPAYAADDVVWGKHNESENDEVITACGGEHPPIIRFGGTKSFAYGVTGAADLEGEGGGAFGWSVLYTVDPRFNYAPEAWYAATGVEPSEIMDGSKWLESISGVLNANGSNGRRDPDIFMFTSDQEYLQSMGELQFLPWTRDLCDKPGQIIEDYAKWNWNYQFNVSAATVLNFMPGMWQTYSAYEGDPIYNLGDPSIEIVSSRGDFRVNPFTQDKRVLTAVIANTPYDYFVASTNDSLNLLGKCDIKKSLPAADAGLSHAFNSKTPCANWTDKRDGGEDDSELERIVNAMHDRFRSGVEQWNGSIANWPRWETIFDNLDWFDGQAGDNQKSFLGVALKGEPLHAVDRKFLHSFWRECFQNRQQLFLVFIRAEPLTVGGSGKASLASAQLGARGVALVWRDPEPPQLYRDQRKSRANLGSLQTWKTSVNSKIPPPPHRTRVLFYHQFD